MERIVRNIIIVIIFYVIIMEFVLMVEIFFFVYVYWDFWDIFVMLLISVYLDFVKIMGFVF